MPDYRQLLNLLLDDFSYRQIESMAGCSHRTIAKAKKALGTRQLTTHAQVDALTDEDIDALFTDGRKASTGIFVPIDLDTVIRARVGRKKPPVKVLWAQYLRTPNPEGLRLYGYERFCQIIADHVRANDLTSPIAHIPGHTMQVDWAGTRMHLTDPITRARTPVSIFVASLPYSGMIFANGCLDEKQAAWCHAHRLAFEYFGGVAQIIIPDNASTASNQISRYEKARDVNPSYADFLEHYGTAAVPARSIHPKDKGHVENGVKIVTNWIIHFLADHVFSTLDDLNTAIAIQVDEINDRTPFRKEVKSRRDWFTEAESGELIGLPDTPWQSVQWRKAKVSRDWHIQVDTIKYSVPYQYTGNRVDVRMSATRVAILADGNIIAEHARGTKRHSYVTDAEHGPHGYEDTDLLWTRAYFLRQAAKVGPSCTRALTRLLDRYRIEAQGFRSCMNILALGKNNRQLLEQACEAVCADEGRPISYTQIKHHLTLIRTSRNARPSTSDMVRPVPRSSSAPPRRDTTGAHLGGAAQFSLAALTKTEGENNA